MCHLQGSTWLCSEEAAAGAVPLAPCFGLAHSRPNRCQLQELSGARQKGPGEMGVTSCFRDGGSSSWLEGLNQVFGQQPEVMALRTVLFLLWFSGRQNANRGREQGGRRCVCTSSGIIHS